MQYRIYGYSYVLRGGNAYIIILVGFMFPDSSVLLYTSHNNFSHLLTYLKTTLIILESNDIFNYGFERVPGASVHKLLNSSETIIGSMEIFKCNTDYHTPKNGEVGSGIQIFSRSGIRFPESDVHFQPKL